MVPLCGKGLSCYLSILACLYLNIFVHIKTILWNYDPANVVLFYESGGISTNMASTIPLSLKQIKLSYMAISVSLFINFHKLRWHVIHNHHTCNYSILVFVIGIYTEPKL